MPDRPKDHSRGGSFFRGLIREPLFHFFFLGALVFAAYGWFGAQTMQVASQRDRIVVTPGRVQQLVHVFQRTWRRPPSPTELNRLIESYVKEEIYYRESVKLGLDKDDTLIRRRMQQKMRFLSEPSEEKLRPTDAELQAYLEANRAAFRTEPKIAFEQVFINDKGQAEKRAQKLLAQLQQASATVDPASFGDHTLLDYQHPLSPVSGIARNFGSDFAEALRGHSRDEWAGPVRSPFGLHLVRINAYEPGRDPPLSEIRDAVLQKWRAEKREAFIEAEYAQMRARYDVVLSFAAEDLPQKVSSK